MIQNFFVVSEQSVIIFLIMGIGYLLGRVGIMTEESEENCSAICLYLTGPAITIFSFQRAFDFQLLNGFLLAIVMSAASILFCSVVARNTIRGNTPAETNVFRSSIIFTNCGMIGFALQSALYGPEGIFFGVAYSCVNSILTWTYGIMLLSGGQDTMNFRKIFLNPGILSAVVGLLMFFGSVILPGPLYTVDQLIGNMHLPLCMLVMGCRLSRIRIRQLFSGTLLWLTALESLLLLPLLCMTAFWLLGIRGMIPVVTLISIACPAGAVTTMFAIHYHNNANLSIKLVSMQTLLSLITLPILVAFSQQLFF